MIKDDKMSSKPTSPRTLICIAAALVFVFWAGERLTTQERHAGATTFVPSSSYMGAVSLQRLRSSNPQYKFEEPTLAASDQTKKNKLTPHGSAGYLFVQMGAYRAGPNTFAVIGLGSKPLHVYANAYFHCKWNSFALRNLNKTVRGLTKKFLPDWGFGRVYTVVVINCTFPEPVGTDGSGGEVEILAYPGLKPGTFETFSALTESRGEYDPAVFSRPPRYDFLHCGSPLFGNVSPQRVREWIAYHAQLFGPRALFVFHDAGGVSEATRKVLKPWIDKGFVILRDVREVEEYDGYYHNQFMVLNDCLHRYKFSARWIFFFDLDEYLYIPRQRSLASVMADFGKYSQVTFAQRRMSVDLCFKSSYSQSSEHSGEWGLEKMVFMQEAQGKQKWERKYALQPKYAEATGVHLSEDIFGETLNTTDEKIMRFYHFHGSTSQPTSDNCKDYIGTEKVDRNGIVRHWGFSLLFDPSLRNLVPSIKRFEMATIGQR